MECKILIGTKAICEHLHISRPSMYKLIKSGAPIIQREGGWTSHVELLEKYFKEQIMEASTKKTR